MFVLVLSWAHDSSLAFVEIVVVINFNCHNKPYLILPPGVDERTVVGVVAAAVVVAVGVHNLRDRDAFEQVVFDALDRNQLDNRQCWTDSMVDIQMSCLFVVLLDRGAAVVVVEVHKSP